MSQCYELKDVMLQAMNDFAQNISPLSKECERVQPGRKSSCSLAVGWTSLLVQTSESSTNVEPFETLATPDHLVVLVTRGECEIESFSNGSWKKAAYRPGLGGMTAGGNTSRLRWRSKIANVKETLHIYIPQFFFTAAAEQYRRAGASFRVEHPDALAFNDPVVSQVAFSLRDAVRAGAPDLYAESAAQFLATHLLSLHSRWSKPLSDVRSPGMLSHYRLKRVLEFMDHHYSEALSVKRLAKEAGVSRFHFVRLFKQSFGLAPHQHLVRLRMQAAATMLESTDLNVQEIATRCGYVSTAHFSTAFRKRFLQTPSEHRAQLYAARPDLR